MKARVKTQILIDTDAETVFKYLSNTAYHHLWNPNLQEVKPLAQLKLEDIYRTNSLILGVRVKSSNHVTKFVQNETLEIENTTGMLQYCVHYQLIPTRKGVKLCCNTVVSAEGKAFAFAKPLLEHLARRELNSDLQLLKQVVEEGQK